MFDGLAQLRQETKNAGGIALGALVFAAWSACGRPGRRTRGHWPFAFDDYTWADVYGVLGATLLAGVMFRRWQERDRLLRHLSRPLEIRAFQPTGAANTIYGLLLAVASHDGGVTAREREIVERVLLRDLPDGVLPQDLRHWTDQDRTQPLEAAVQLAQILTPSERVPVLRWCREVAAAESAAGATETELLRDLARILGGK